MAVTIVTIGCVMPYGVIVPHRASTRSWGFAA